jgi:uncharacterized RDD family membrane protein YckC
VTPGDEPSWDEVPLVDAEPKPAGENLPLFDAGAGADTPGAGRTRRRSPRRPDAGPGAAAEPPREPAGPALRAASPSAPTWVQTALVEAEAETTVAPLEDLEPATARPEPEPREPGPPPSLPQRLLAGVADLVLHMAVLAATLVGESLLGLQPEPRQWPGFAVFLICFSFLYTTVPLAFWGQTPGMAWRGLRARDAGDRPLAFGQTALRWLGGLLTVALAGLPAFLALAGGSLADRLSRSETIAEYA